MTSHLPLGLDATYSLDPQPTGVAVYSREILFGLARLCPEERIAAYYRLHRYRRALGTSLPANIHRRLLVDLAAPKADVFHGLNQRLPARIRSRSVVTFHDLFMLTGNYSTPKFRMRFAEFSRDAARRADLIIAVSNFTAGQVADLLNVERSRIRVVSHGVYPARDVPPIEARERIVLHVGALQTRKNILRLVEAFEWMPPDWQLVLAGGMGFGADEILERISKSARHSGIQIAGYVGPQQLAMLYRRAAILAFPSLDEGFGIPILDAMANGVAVITSNRSATIEVAANAAWLIDPEDTAQLGQALTQLADDRPLRAHYTRLGLSRAAEFTWEKAVLSTRAVYRELGL